MHEEKTKVNSTGNLGIAPLRNVQRLYQMIEQTKNRRNAKLPGLLCFYGNSGRGKSYAASYSMNKHNAVFVAVKSTWTKKHLCTSILHQLGRQPEGTVCRMIDDIGEELAKSRRPLIIDDAQYLAHRNMIEIPRDIFESCLGVIALIGEENMPNILRKSERVHNRVYDWGHAEPCNLEDCIHLASIYCPNITIHEDLLSKINDRVEGCTRRVCTNLDHIYEYSLGKSLTEIDVASYKGRIITGEPTAGY